MTELEPDYDEPDEAAALAEDVSPCDNHGSVVTPLRLGLPANFTCPDDASLPKDPSSFDTNHFFAGGHGIDAQLTPTSLASKSSPTPTSTATTSELMTSEADDGMPEAAADGMAEEQEERGEPEPSIQGASAQGNLHPASDRQAPTANGPARVKQAEEGGGTTGAVAGEAQCSRSEERPVDCYPCAGGRGISTADGMRLQRALQLRKSPSRGTHYTATVAGDRVYFSPGRGSGTAADTKLSLNEAVPRAPLSASASAPPTPETAEPVVWGELEDIEELEICPDPTEYSAAHSSTGRLSNPNLTSTASTSRSFPGFRAVAEAASRQGSVQQGASSSRPGFKSHLTPLSKPASATLWQPPPWLGPRNGVGLADHANFPSATEEFPTSHPQFYSLTDYNLPVSCPSDFIYPYEDGPSLSSSYPRGASSSLEWEPSVTPLYKSPPAASCGAPLKPESFDSDGLLKELDGLPLAAAKFDTTYQPSCSPEDTHGSLSGADGFIDPNEVDRLLAAAAPAPSDDSTALNLVSYFNGVLDREGRFTKTSKSFECLPTPTANTSARSTSTADDEMLEAADAAVEKHGQPEVSVQGTNGPARLERGAEDDGGTRAAPRGRHAERPTGTSPAAASSTATGARAPPQPAAPGRRTRHAAPEGDDEDYVPYRRSSAGPAAKKPSRQSPITQEHGPSARGGPRAAYNQRNQDGSKTARGRGHRVSGSVCLMCNATDTSQWRGSPLGKRTLCTACYAHGQKEKKKQKSAGSHKRR